jgi:hypothetical protein
LQIAPTAIAEVMQTLRVLPLRHKTVPPASAD